MHAYDFCAEYAHETPGGAIRFKKSVVHKFITRYTYLKPEDFTPSMIQRLRMVMVDYYNLGLKAINGIDYPEGKIELPEFIFQ